MSEVKRGSTRDAQGRLPMGWVRAKIAAGGRLVIPVAFRRAMGVKEGDQVIVRLDERGLHVSTMSEVIRRAQAAVKRYVPRDRSLSGELLQERREEAGREAGRE